MQSLSSDKQELVLDILIQIRQAIIDLEEWNKDIQDMNELTHSPLGMQRLSGNCMMIQAICEGVKQVSKIAGDDFFSDRPEIPWKQVKGMRDRIAHGYFDLDADYITDIIKNDLQPLAQALDYFILKLNK